MSRTLEEIADDVLRKAGADFGIDVDETDPLATGHYADASAAILAAEAESDKAILVEIEGEKFWVPKSQIHDDSEVYSKASGGGTLIVTEWWAEQKGLV